MAEMMLRGAIAQTLHDEMLRDENVVVLGEDIVGGMGTEGGPEATGGIWGTSPGLFDKFGPERVMDTPISESAIVGAAAGLALTGKRPVAEIMFADFVGVCLDQLWNQLGKFRYMFGGKTECPAVIRMSYGAGVNAAAQHSQAVYSMLTALPGLKVVMPTTPADAKGLLTTAIRGSDPVIFMEHKALYASRGDVPDGDYLIPFGQARMVHKGEDVTIVTCGFMVTVAAAAAAELAKEGINCDVIDLRTTSPLDEDTILDSIEVSGRLVVLDESNPRCSLATDITAFVAENAFSSLKAPPQLVTAPHTPVPFARELERAYLPNKDNVIDAVRFVMNYKSGAA